MSRNIFILFLLLLSVSCGKQEYVVFDHPYVYVTYSKDLVMSETSTVLSMSNNLVRDYNFTLSSKTPSEPIVVHYQITHGDGLTEGVDYELLSQSDTVVFNPGTFVRPISIKFLRRKVSKDQDNTLTIKITSSDPPMTIGVPGAEPKNTFHTIKKIN